MIIFIHQYENTPVAVKQTEKQRYLLSHDILYRFTRFFFSLAKLYVGLYDYISWIWPYFSGSLRDVAIATKLVALPSYGTLSFGK